VNYQYKTEIRASVHIHPDVSKANRPHSYNFDVTSFEVDAGEREPDRSAYVSVSFNADEAYIMLSMEPDQARRLAEAILRNGAVSPEQN
jgi:hypothetical protein